MRADVLTASLRANPIFYADSQLVPYGSDSVEAPDGPTQYDVNISHPLDYFAQATGANGVCQSCAQGARSAIPERGAAGDWQPLQRLCRRSDGESGCSRICKRA